MSKLQKQIQKTKYKVDEKLDQIDFILSISREFSQSFDAHTEKMHSIILSLLDTDIEEEDDFESAQKIPFKPRFTFGFDAPVIPTESIPYLFQKVKSGGQLDSPAADSLPHHYDQSENKYFQRQSTEPKMTKNSKEDIAYSKKESISQGDMFSLFREQNANIMEMVSNGKESSKTLRKTLGKLFDSFAQINDAKVAESKTLKLKSKVKSLKKEVDNLKEEKMNLKVEKTLHEETLKLYEKSRNGSFIGNSESRSLSPLVNTCCEKHKQVAEERGKTIHVLSQKNQSIYMELSQANSKIQRLEDSLQQMQEEFFVLYKNVHASFAAPNSCDNDDMLSVIKAPNNLRVSLDSQQGFLEQLAPLSRQPNSREQNQPDSNQILNPNDNNSIQQNSLGRRNYSFSYDEGHAEINIVEADNFDENEQKTFKEMILKPKKECKNYSSLDEQKFEQDDRLFASLPHHSENNIFDDQANSKQITIQIHDNSEGENENFNKYNKENPLNNIFKSIDDNSDNENNSDQNDNEFQAEEIFSHVSSGRENNSDKKDDYKNEQEEEERYSVIEFRSHSGSQQELVSVTSERFEVTPAKMVDPTDLYEDFEADKTMKKKKFNSAEVVEMIFSQSLIMEDKMAFESGEKEKCSNLEENKGSLTHVGTLENFYTFSNHELD